MYCFCDRRRVTATKQGLDTLADELAKCTIHSKLSSSDGSNASGIDYKPAVELAWVIW
jgi:hypothetical protein